MSVDKFKFVSPGVFVAEVDNSQLPEEPRGVGPVIIGRSLKGPALRPVQVNSFSDFVETFGNPIFGAGSSDVWRDGPNVSAPSYATYAAQAYLRNKSPAIFVRLCGIEDENAKQTGNGRAGWNASTSSMDSDPQKGGAYGLFLVNSASTGETLSGGKLGAIFYCKEGAVVLSGTMADNATEATGTCGLFLQQGAGNEYTALIKDGTGANVDKVVFNFDTTSKLYIRNVFNTNPTQLPTANNENPKTYFLGETFDRNIDDATTSEDASKTCGVILGLQSGTVGGASQHIQRMPLKPSQTGWFFSQDFGASGSYVTTNMPKLFRFMGLDSGEWAQGNLKITITDIKASPNENRPFGTFTVQLRAANDSDNSPRPIETFSDVDLNPASPNYIARVMGDSYTKWNDTKVQYDTIGDYVNKSRYIRVEVDRDVANGTVDPKSLPFGVYGPQKWRGFNAISGATDACTGTLSSSTSVDRFVVGGSGVAFSLAAPPFTAVADFVSFGAAGTPFETASLDFPSVPTRTNSNEGLITNQKNAAFGATTNMNGSNRMEPSIVDLVRRKPDNVDSLGTPADALEYSWTFSLDDITTGSANTGVIATWLPGSRANGTSKTALGDYKSVLTAGQNRFTTVFNAGFEGLNVLEAEPFTNTLLTLAGGDASIEYAYASVDRAIASVADAEVVECNMMTLPGITTDSLTNKLMSVCEARADALAIIDLDGGYEPETESTAPQADRMGSVGEVIRLLENRNINNSYGCCYYPWVQITDTVTTGGSLWVPPSVVALGTFASSEAASELWFAPAGFNRGGLTEGSAGLPVTNVRERLTSEDRDNLYTININPIAQFPAEGIVIFGQKTMQITRSALDRINVRRMLIYVKREISRIAARLLFDQNLSTTWNRFLGQVNPFLGGVKTRLGLTDFKVLLDETTTTPDLVDRNIMYAKIFLKPARAIEFIALDFVVTRSGASFDD